MKYLIKRFKMALIVLAAVSIIIFIMIHLQPGNPYANMIDPSVPPEMVEKRLESIGYYDPVPIQYIKWVGRLLRGDMGYSIVYKAPVASLITKALKNTIVLSAASLIVSTLISILLGLLSAEKPNSIIDNIINALCFTGISLPTFFIGLMFVKIFSLSLGWFPASGMKTLTGNLKGFKLFLDMVKHAALPVGVLAFTQIAVITRYIRSAMIKASREDFILAAKARGLTHRKSLISYGLRNSMVTIITVVGMQLPVLFSGALITETVFVWPGMGLLNYNAVLSKDYPLIMGITMMVAVLIIASNLLADVLYVVVDPRIRLTGEGDENAK
ncbi:MAG: ABC transporter permease [Tissierellia bacterium]|nr:ABC transporter permease [Tissierellia bacterium]